MEVLDNARAALALCRSRVPPTFPDGVFEIPGTRPTVPRVGVDEKEFLGFKSRTFFNSHENVEVTIASNGKFTIVAVPKIAIGRANQMGDDEYNCLKKCLDIADTEKRLNCILLCPVSKNYNIFVI